MEVFYTYIIPLLLIIILLLMLSMVWPPDSPWAPWWRTDNKSAMAACKLADITSKDVVYELGSGDAGFLLYAVKKFRVKGVGIEIDPLRVFISRLFIKFYGLSGKVKILKGNFYDYDISEASIVFVYLVPKALERLKPKLMKELKQGTRLISFRYKAPFPLIRKDKKHNIYLHKIIKRK